MRSDISSRLKKLERARPEAVDPELVKIRLILSRCTDAELTRFGEIIERTHDGRLPLSPEEQAFVDEMERKYSTFGNIERYEAYFSGDESDLSDAEKAKLAEHDRYFEDLEKGGSDVED